MLVTLVFIASLLEWMAIVRSENTETALLTSGTERNNKIIIPIGGSANITCHAFQRENSSTIWFYENNFKRTIRQPHRDIIILDDKTAVLTIHNASKHIFEYHCLNENGNHIKKTEVFVGSPPEEITDFSCRSFDFNFMTCTFTRPQNFIYTAYEVNYTDSPNKICKKTCKDLVENGNQITCNLTGRFDSFYIMIQDMYYFNITGENELGTRSHIEVVNHYNVVVPPKLDVKLENITTESVTLTWQNDKYMYYKNITLEHEIRWQPLGLNDYFETEHYCSEEKCRVVIDNLKYAFYNYSLRIHAKVKEAPSIEKMWSEPYTTTFLTKSKRPDYPPSTGPGSFDLDSQLYLYWRELKEYEHNGPGFHYVITEVDKKGNILNEITTLNSVVSFEWNEMDKRKERLFYIKTKNVNGSSLDSTMIRAFSSVFQQNAKDYKARLIVKEYQNNIYVLSWKPPKQFEDVSNYTVYWCAEARATTNRCAGTINYKIVDKSHHNFTLEPQNKSLNLAVSANYKNYLTGMNWACYADESTVITFEPAATVLSDKSINVYWSLGRSCNAIIQDYNLTYCQTSKDAILKDKFTPKCITEPITEILKEDAKNFEIKNLIPYSKYKIQMSMSANKKVETKNDIILVKTKESAPTQPRNITIVNLTCHSATISWLPPMNFNGELQFYTIFAESEERNSSSRLSRNQLTEIDYSNIPVNYTIERLNDFTEYTIYVAAHTANTVEANYSEPFKMKTLIGRLESPHPGASIENGAISVINWTEPARLSSLLEYYEVAVFVKQHDNKIVEKIITTKNNTCRFKKPECRGSDFQYTLKVRAVYAAEKDEIDHTMLPENALSAMSYSNNRDLTQAESLYVECLGEVPPEAESLSSEIKLSSPWETAILFSDCPVKYSTFTSIAIVIIFLALLVMAYGGCKKYKKMNNIDVVLPPGLVDHLSAYKSNSNNSSIGIKHDDEKSDLSRSNDCLVNRKDNFHVIASNGILPIIEHTNDDRFSVEREFNHAFHRDETDEDRNSSQSTDSVEFNDLSGESFFNIPTNNDTQFTNEISQNNVSTTIPAQNGYVSIPTSNNVNIGYITADRINSFQTNLRRGEETKKNLNDITPNSNNNMYVTPAQLAQIGRSECLN